MPTQSNPITKPEFRKHYFLNQYVIIAPKRGGRPRDIPKPTAKVLKQSPTPCVLCPEKLDTHNVVCKVGNCKDYGWQVAVIENDFPAVRLDNPSAYGKQEVVIETPQHGVDLTELPLDHIIAVFDVYAGRVAELHENKELDYILIFKNEGGRAGASLQHSHSQIFASSFMPPDLVEEAQCVQKYKDENGACPYCDILEREEKGERQIYVDDFVVAFTPYASQFNYEAWILPRRHIDNITQLTTQEKKSFAKALKKILGKLESIDHAYNFYLHDAIPNPNQHFYLKIAPRGSIWAGVELGSGLVINPIVPEDAAEFYRG